MSFDPEKVERWNCYERGGPYSDGEWVSAKDFDQLKSLLHDVSTEADPAGTLRELRLAQDTVKAQELLIQELRAEIEVLRGEGR